MRTTIIAGLFVMLCSAAPIAQPATYAPPAASASVVNGVDFRTASPIDESYRQEFDRCDQHNTFQGQPMRGFRKCSNDPNRLKALLRFPDGTIFFESKLGLDIDGSWKACHSPGAADQCPTWFHWKNLSPPDNYVDSDKYAFIVIPIAGLHGRDDLEFRQKTGIDRGDLGIAIYKDKVVPVFVADGGPHNKVGEGSAALFKALGEDRCTRRRPDGHCERYRDFSIPGGVLFFLFPNSRIDDLTPGSAAEKISTSALARFEALKHH